MLSAPLNKPFPSFFTTSINIHQMCVEMFYLQLYGIGNMVKDNSAREEPYFHHYMEYSFQSAARELLYVLCRHNDTYHGICYTSHTALAVCGAFFNEFSIFYNNTGKKRSEISFSSHYEMLF